MVCAVPSIASMFGLLVRTAIGCEVTCYVSLTLPITAQDEKVKVSFRFSVHVKSCSPEKGHWKPRYQHGNITIPMMSERMTQK